MPQQFVFDDVIILKVQGLRFVVKEDYVYSSSHQNDSYRLRWNYKGADGYHDYETKTERDTIFDLIVKEIKKEE